MSGVWQLGVEPEYTVMHTLGGTELRYRNKDYIVCATAKDMSGLHSDDPWIDVPQVSLTWDVKRSYYSETDLHKRWPVRDHNQQHVFPGVELPYHSLESSTPQDLWREFMLKFTSSMIRTRKIPFPMYHNRLRWKQRFSSSSSNTMSPSAAADGDGGDGDGNNDEEAAAATVTTLLTPLVNEFDVVEKICSVLDDRLLSGRGKMAILVTLDKQITLPRQQYAALRAEILHGHQLNMSLLERARFALSIEALEKFRLIFEDINQTVEICAVCTDEMLSGCEVISMLCSHMFHADCVLKWLRTHPTCPLCRFHLPPS